MLLVWKSLRAPAACRIFGAVSLSLSLEELSSFSSSSSSTSAFLPSEMEPASLFKSMSLDKLLWDSETEAERERASTATKNKGDDHQLCIKRPVQELTKI